MQQHSSPFMNPSNQKRSHEQVDADPEEENPAESNDLIAHEYVKPVSTIYINCLVEDCPITAPSMFNLNIHLFEHHHIMEHRCPAKNCPFSSNKLNKYRNHRQSSHSHLVTWNCPYCQKQFPDHIELSFHIEKAHTIGHYECGMKDKGCNFWSYYMEPVEEHFNRRHKPPEMRRSVVEHDKGVVAAEQANKSKMPRTATMTSANASNSPDNSPQLVAKEAPFKAANQSPAKLATDISISGLAKTTSAAPQLRHSSPPNRPKEQLIKNSRTRTASQDCAASQEGNRGDAPVERGRGVQKPVAQRPTLPSGSSQETRRFGEDRNQLQKAPLHKPTPASKATFCPYRIVYQYCLKPECKETFSNDDDMNVHLKEQHAIDRFRCPLFTCRATFPSRQQLDHHLDTVHRDVTVWNCFYFPESCSSQFSDPHQLWPHFQQAHFTGLYRCAKEYCHFQGHTRLAVCEHFYSSHQNDRIADSEHPDDSGCQSTRTSGCEQKAILTTTITLCTSSTEESSTDDDEVESVQVIELSD